MSNFKHPRIGATGLCAAMLGACAAAPLHWSAPEDCGQLYASVDQRINDAGVQDAGAHRIAGFPYLRANRFLASFRNDVHNPEQWQAWMTRLLALDRDHRDAELDNLAVAQNDGLRERLHACGGLWASADLQNPQRREQLRAAVQVPDDYSTLRRWLGMYPVMVPFLKMGMDDFNADVRADYSTPVADLAAPGSLQLWQAAASSVPWPGPVTRDALGIPVLNDGHWQDLAQRHVPQWWIESASAADVPGRPVLQDGEPSVDRSQPVVHVQPGYTRFGDEVLLQLSYTIWFSARPKQQWIDSYAGALDGVVWRVTLDAQEQPLVYDTIHACGCYHYWFPAQPLKQRPQHETFAEPVLLPQSKVPAAPFAIRLQAGTHYVRRLVPLSEIAETGRREFSVQPYRALLSLPDRHGGSYSLFGVDGLVAGSERFERWWLWPSGVISPGAMRQWGRHATAFIGRNHFDDPYLLQRVFRPPTQ